MHARDAAPPTLKQVKTVLAIEAGGLALISLSGLLILKHL
jgi:hypothetical protein